MTFDDRSTAFCERLKKQALAQGWSAVGICKPEDVDISRRLEEFLSEDRHGQMTWMANRRDWRGRPATLWPEAKSVIVLADNYGPERDPLEGLDHPSDGNISVYARGRDYHDVMKKRLKVLARWIVQDSANERDLAQSPGDTQTEVKVFVDTAPVPEKALAQVAGLGWQGKHTNLVSRELGSWFFLGLIFTTAPLPVDTPEQDHCGSCTSCLDICPTDAFPAPYQLDARRCISYLTIEHRGPVDRALRPLLGNRIYGCDDCLAVCPWNKFAQTAHEIKYAPAGAATMPLADMAVLDDAGFRERFSGSPIKRIKRDRFVRNVLYAIGNSRDKGLLAPAQTLCEDPDDAVGDAARWAVEQLRSP